MLELDSLVDGVAVVTYGTPESAAATRAASEGTAGVRGGGRGGGGTGAASFAVGEQLQNMVLVVHCRYLWVVGVRGGGAAPAMVRRRGGVRGEAILYVIGKQGPVVRPVRAESRVAL